MKLPAMAGSNDPSRNTANVPPLSQGRSSNPWAHWRRTMSETCPPTPTREEPRWPPLRPSQPNRNWADQSQAAGGTGYHTPSEVPTPTRHEETRASRHEEGYRYSGAQTTGQSTPRAWPKASMRALKASNDPQAQAMAANQEAEEATFPPAMGAVDRTPWLLPWNTSAPNHWPRPWPLP